MDIIRGKHFFVMFKVKKNSKKTENIFLIIYFLHILIRVNLTICIHFYKKEKINSINSSR